MACALTSMLQKLDLVSAVDEAAAAHGLKARAARNVVRTLLFVLKGAVKYSVSGSALKDDLVSLGLEEERAAWVGSAWEVASLRVSVALGDKASDLDAGALIDAEWRFGVTVSTDDLARVGSTYLQMRLLTDSGAGRLDTHHLELTVPQFYDLLSQLEKAKSYCDYLQSA